jgi:carboxymethylenebutenolidase
MALIKSRKVDFEVAGKPVSGYLAAPDGGGNGLLVLHAWWGLTPFYGELCGRLAGEGFTTFAPDLSAGKTAQTIEAAQEMMSARDLDATREVAMASVDTLLRQPGVQPGKLGAVGFSAGAAWAMLLAGLHPQQIAAVVIFYGIVQVDASQVRAAVQGHFAEDDEWDPIDEARQMERQLRAAGLQTHFYTYPGAGHWFFEEDRPDAYNAVAARTAWERMVPFFKKELGQ